MSVRLTSVRSYSRDPKRTIAASSEVRSLTCCMAVPLCTIWSTSALFEGARLFRFYLSLSVKLPRYLSLSFFPLTCVANRSSSDASRHRHRIIFLCGAPLQKQKRLLLSTARRSKGDQSDIVRSSSLPFLIVVYCKASKCTNNGTRTSSVSQNSYTTICISTLSSTFEDSPPFKQLTVSHISSFTAALFLFSSFLSLLPLITYSLCPFSITILVIVKQDV